MTRALVAAVIVLAAVAVADSLRSLATAEPASGRVEARGRTELVAARPLRPGGGGYLEQRVLRDGREVLAAEALKRAFPGGIEGPIDIAQLALGPDGTLVVGVYSFPSGRAPVGALELWRGSRLVGAFRVPTGWFGGGLAFDRTGELVATFSHDRQLRGVFDRRGRRRPGLPDSFLLVG